MSFQFRPALALSVLAGLLAPGLSAQRPESFTLTGTRVAVYDLAGRVSVVPATSGPVVVELTRGGADGAKLATAQDPIAGTATFRVLYPADRIVYRPKDGRYGNWRTEVDVRDDGTFDGDDRSGRRVRISGSGDGLEAWADLTVRVPKGQRIAIHLAVGAVTAQNVDGDITLDTGDGDITASALAGRASLNSGSGDVRVTGAGELYIDTGSGDVRVSGVKGDALDIDTGSGAVTADAVAVDALSVNTGSGDVQVTGLTARTAKFDTGSGNVEAEYGAAPADVDVDTGSGDVTLTMPAGFGGTVDFSTSGGDIRTDFPVTTHAREDGELHGTIGTGSGRIHVETGSGDIALRQR
ncbi:MAG TPA: DUF4097 family beta strand repeat-containing protein [Gemmatimonadales bacterium]|nr:DUF4097 family beta strand repeat-containing protein [Gemmatimonadales bacterium]